MDKTKTTIYQTLPEFIHGLIRGLSLSLSLSPTRTHTLTHFHSDLAERQIVRSIEMVVVYVCVCVGEGGGGGGGGGGGRQGTVPISLFLYPSPGSIYRSIDPSIDLIDLFVFIVNSVSHTQLHSLAVVNLCRYKCTYQIPWLRRHSQGKYM